MTDSIARGEFPDYVPPDMVTADLIRHLAGALRLALQLSDDTLRVEIASQARGLDHIAAAYDQRADVVTGRDERDRLTPGTFAHVAELPDCDVHLYERGQAGVPAGYDGKTQAGPWAYMCGECFVTHGTGLGVGQGQRLLVRGDDGQPS